MDKRIEILEAAVKKTRKWAENGWEKIFSGNQINSLTEAEELSDSNPSKKEALEYWENIKSISLRASAKGDMTIYAIQNGQLPMALNYIQEIIQMEKEIFPNGIWQNIITKLEKAEDVQVEKDCLISRNAVIKILESYETIPAMIFNEIAELDSYDSDKLID